MKPFIQISAALALAAIATAFTACSSEEFGDSASADSADGSVMTFTCQAPALQTATTRAYSDGQKADNLYYAVYALSGDDNSTPTLCRNQLARHCPQRQQTHIRLTTKRARKPR